MTTPVTPNAPRQGLGNFFGALLDFLDARKIRDQVAARVSPGTAALMARPPRAFAFVESKPIDEIEGAVEVLLGGQALVDLGRFTAEKLGGSVVQPVLRAAFFLFGEKPESAFANLDRFFSLVTRGVTFRWTASGPRAGAIDAYFAGPGTPEAAFHVLRGTLMYVYDLVGTPGEVGAPAIVASGEQGSHVRFDVRW